MNMKKLFLLLTAFVLMATGCKGTEPAFTTEFTFSLILVSNDVTDGILFFV